MGKQKMDELTEDEKRIRIEEDKLFKKMSAPPSKLEGVLDVLDDDQCKESLSKQRQEDKKKRRKKDEMQSTKLKKLRQSDLEH